MTPLITAKLSRIEAELEDLAAEAAKVVATDHIVTVLCAHGDLAEAPYRHSHPTMDEPSWGLIAAQINRIIANWRPTGEEVGAALDFLANRPAEKRRRHPGPQEVPAP